MRQNGVQIFVMATVTTRDRTVRNGEKFTRDKSFGLLSLCEYVAGGLRDERRKREEKEQEEKKMGGRRGQSERKIGESEEQGARIKGLTKGIVVPIILSITS